MTITDLNLYNAQLQPANDKTAGPQPQTPEEAAKTFEKVLVEQFVSVMTDQLFKSNLSGDEGPGWMKAYGDSQRKTLTEVLSKHLVDNGTFNISDAVLQQMKG